MGLLQRIRGRIVKKIIRPWRGPIKPWRNWRNSYARRMQQRDREGMIVRAMHRAIRAAIKAAGGSS